MAERSQRIGSIGGDQRRAARRELEVVQVGLEAVARLHLRDFSVAAVSDHVVAEAEAVRRRCLPATTSAPGLPAYSWTRKLLAETCLGSGLNQTTPPPGSRIIGPACPGPEYGATKMSPALRPRRGGGHRRRRAGAGRGASGSSGFPPPVPAWIVSGVERDRDPGGRSRRCPSSRCVAPPVRSSARTVTRSPSDERPRGQEARAVALGVGRKAPAVAPALRAPRRSARELAGGRRRGS